MQTTITADITAPPHHVLEIVSDLATYPRWLSVVSEAAPTEAIDTEPSPIWIITLRAKVGPFARSKRLRMARLGITDTEAVFERAEIDGREHSTWRMVSSVAEGPAGSLLSMDLSYDGSMWSGPLEAILQSEASDAGPRLSELARQR